MDKIKIAIIGATGYTGSELVRILYQHKNVELVGISSESRAGEKFSDVHSSFYGLVDIELKKADDLLNEDLDLVFLALPHGVSMSYVKKIYNKKFKIIDLSGDFRLDDADVYEEWYNKKHELKDQIDEFIYGLPELNKEEIKKAKFIANPGCYPTASTLGLAPLVKKDLVENNSIVIDAKSGLTGAGVKSSPTTHFSNVNDNFKAYGLVKHRHTIEIENNLNGLNNSNHIVQFTPHLLPVDRGILSAIYLTPNKELNKEEINNIYKEYYKNSPFVRIVNSVPSIKDVRASNYCNIYVDHDKRTNRIIIISVIDNLVKGAAGLAVQNMNLMFGFNEIESLENLPINP